MRPFTTTMESLRFLNDVPSTGTDPALQDFYSKFVSTEKFALGAHDRWPAGMSNNWKKSFRSL